MQENFGEAAALPTGVSGDGTGLVTGEMRRLPGRWFRGFILLASVVLTLPTGHGLASSDGATGPGSDIDQVSVCNSCREFDRLNTLIRDGGMPERESRTRVVRLLTEIGEWYRRHGGERYDRSHWVFPLRGYSVKAVGGGRNHGYLPHGYDYFDGNRHLGHPSLDIFIQDRNRDNRDDRTGEYVAVLSISGGIVVSREPEWDSRSRLRGGNYLWVYDPSTDHLFYYAHLHTISVAIGAIVKPGDTLGSVGRTGLNAYKKRSPTHLHLTVLSTTTASLLPVNIYRDLTHARSVE